MGEVRPVQEVGPGPVEEGILPSTAERLLVALDESPIGTALVALDGRFLRVNRAYAQMAGYSREELTRLTFQAITHQADLEVDLELKKKMAHGEIGHYKRTKRYVRKDGSIVFVRLCVSFVRDRDGAPICHLAQIEDITERVQADEALRRSEASFRRLFDQASDGIFIIDLEGRYIDVNAAACEMLGYSHEELVGKTIADLLPIEDVPQMIETRKRLLAPGRTHVGEATVRRKDGVFIRLEVSAKFFPDGREVVFVRDISERKRAEREREDSLRWMRAVLEQSPVGLVLCPGPTAGRIESNGSLQQMAGSPIDTIEQLRGLLRMPDGQPIPAGLCACERALRGERTASTELVLHDARGGATPVVATAAPILGADGVVLGGVLAVQDISATKELERLRSEWSSVVAHDLRQPLGAISLNAQSLTRLTDDPRLVVRLERIRASAQRLNRMVEDLMDLSRVDARRLELVRQPVDVPALVRASAERMALEAADRSIAVHVDGDVPAADADPDRVAQMLENLLTNAVKYGNDGTPIEVAVARGRGEIAVAVTNEGSPLVPEELSGLFQRFQRTSSAKLQGIKGTGLGLYITRSLVEAHGGRITAESTPHGRITFRFTLPMADVVRVDARTS